MTLTFWDGSASWQFGSQPPTLLASETNESVAMPLREPAAAVVMPTCSDELLVAPGASRLKLPLAVSGDAVLMLAFSAACGATVAWFVTLTNCVGAVSPTRTLPSAIVGVLMTGTAWLITCPWIVPSTRKLAEPTPSSPSPLLTPLTAPALKKLIAMAPSIVAAEPVLTLTVMPEALVLPASRLAI